MSACAPERCDRRPAVVVPQCPAWVCVVWRGGRIKITFSHALLFMKRSKRSRGHGAPAFFRRSVGGRARVAKCRIGVGVIIVVIVMKYIYTCWSSVISRHVQKRSREPLARRCGSGPLCDSIDSTCELYKRIKLLVFLFICLFFCSL